MGRIIKIGNRNIGEEEPVYIIAEAGVNHNGDLEIAKQLVEMARYAGADAIKFQKRTIEKILTKEGLDRPYINENSFGKTYGEHRKALELSNDAFYELKKYSEERQLQFLASAWDEESADFLEKIGVPAIKIPSADLINLPLLKHVAKKNLPILLSTGMANIDEVEEAVNTILHYHNDLVLLQCTSTYPARFEDLNLNVLKTYKEKFGPKGVLLGYSGHEKGITVPLVAYMLGACVIERHFTLDRTMKGGDHAASLEPDVFKRLVRDIRIIPRALGSMEKRILDIEKPIREKLAKSLASKVRIPKGTKITQDMLCVKGPGYGLPPKYYYLAEGAIALKDIEEDTVIKEGDIQLKDENKDK